MEEKLFVSFIIEMMGKPKKHLEDSLKKLVEEFGKEKGVILVRKTLHKAKRLKTKEKTEEIFTTFAEIEAEFDGIDLLFWTIFKYMPSYIEVIKPEILKLNVSQINSISNELTRKLHRYDEIAKILTMEKIILENKLKEVMKKG